MHRNSNNEYLCIKLIDLPVFRTQTVNAAIAEAEKIRLIGGAEAQALQAVGVSEAEHMRMKAAVYKKYGEAAILNIALNALPKVRDPPLQTQCGRSNCRQLKYIEKSHSLVREIEVQ